MILILTLHLLVTIKDHILLTLQMHIQCPILEYMNIPTGTPQAIMSKSKFTDSVMSHHISTRKEALVQLLTSACQELYQTHQGLFVLNQGMYVTFLVTY